MREIRVVGAAILRGDAVLVARRAPGKSLAGAWELPGGKVEPGETDETALEREIAEELRLVVRAHERIGESIHEQGDRRIRLVAYRCDDDGGEPVSDDHDAIVWLTAATLDTVAWAPADLDLLPPLRALLARRTAR